MTKSWLPNSLGACSLAYLIPLSLAIPEFLHAQDLRVVVNVSEGWIMGEGAAGAVGVTLVAPNGNEIAVTEVDVRRGGSFQLACEDDWEWGGCRRFEQGAMIRMESETGELSVGPIGRVDAEVDYRSNVVSGMISAPSGFGTVPVVCVIQGQGSTPQVETTASANGGRFTCDFGAVGLELNESQTLVVEYEEPSGTRLMFGVR